MSRGGRGFRRVLKGAAILVLLVPGTWAVLRALGVGISRVWQGNPRVFWPLAGGAAAYLVLERLFSRPVRVYVFSHELTHALSCALSGGRVYDFHASSRGGHVKVSKTNLWIALSPYFVPFYALLVFLAYRLAGVWWEVAPQSAWFQGLVGAGLAFHVSLTVFALRCRQPDLKVLGFLPSLAVILFGNILFMAFFIKILFPERVEIGEMARVFGAGFLEALRFIEEAVRAAWGELRSAFLR